MTKATVVATLVLILCLAIMVEASAWAAVYVAVGALTGFENALYFSAVTCTTLGFGDVVLDERWRMLSSFQAASGIIIFGWSTALIVAAVNRLYMDQGGTHHV